MAETTSEKLFEAFCSTNGLQCEKVPAGSDPTPDYLVTLPSGQLIYFEIKQIEESSGFARRNGSSTRTVGDHVRARISDSRRQIRYGASRGVPSVLLIHNHLDPLQLFGTEQHDFLAALYGEMTVVLRAGKIAESYHGRNSMVREAHNTSLSAVGHLVQNAGGAEVLMYENAFARNKLEPRSLPECIQYCCVEVDQSAA